MRSKLNDRALLDPNGSVYMPATVENARMLYERYGAAPADPERFPWTCGDAQQLWTAPSEFGVMVHVECVLVDGHVGDHRSEVGW